MRLNKTSTQTKFSSEAFHVKNLKTGRHEIQTEDLLFVLLRYHIE